MKKNFGFLSHLDLNLYLFRTPIMQELINRGCKVYAICPKGDKNKDLKKLGCKVVNYEIDRRGLNPFSEKKSIDNIYSAIKDLNLDILHTFTAKPNIYGTFAARKAGVPIVLNLVEGLGSFYVHNNLKSRVIRMIMEGLYKKAFKQSNGCVFVNNDDPQYMLQKNIITKEKVKVIKSVGVDTVKFNMNNFTELEIFQKKQEIGVENKTVVMMIARAIWDKGIKEFYETASLLKKEYSDIEFVLVGDTDEGNHTCASKEFLMSGSVQWLGHRDDIASLIAICDIFVLPSYREGLPATLMEACAMSKPIVTTDAVGCRDVVEDGVNGFLVPVRNSQVLAEKIEVLLNSQELRIEMGEKALQKASIEFDVRKVVQQYMEYYETFV